MGWTTELWDRVRRAIGRGTRSNGTEAPALFADTPISLNSDDRLGFGPYANALADLIDSPATYTPLTLAISAPWGAGKTSLANLVQEQLVDRPLERGEHSHIVCWFNAWMHDDAPHLGSAFAADVAKTANRYRPIWRRCVSPLPGGMLSPEERWRRRLIIAGLALLAAAPVAALPDVRDLFGVDRLRVALTASLASGTAILALVYGVWSKLFAIAQAAASFVDDPRSEAAKGSMLQVRDQLGKLIRQSARRRRLVIFVDDLERCRPPRAVEVCEVASQLLGHTNVVTVLIADMNVIAASAGIKYAKLEGKYLPADGSDQAWPGASAAYGRLYLQKIVQIQFDLPIARPQALRAMVQDGI